MKHWSAEAGALVCVCVCMLVAECICVRRPLACPKLYSLLANSPFWGPCFRVEFLVPQRHHILSWISVLMHFLKCLPPLQLSWNTEDPVTVGLSISGGSFPQHPAALSPKGLRCFLYAPVRLIFVAAVNTTDYSFSAYFSCLPWSISYSSLGTMS